MPVSILWVEDERHRVERLEYLLENEYLRKEGIDYSITFAENGTEAIQKLYDNDFTLIILDIMMPLGMGMDPSIEAKRTGIEILRMIRSGRIKDRKINKDTPVIVLTSVSDTNGKEEITTLSVSDYLLKPIRADVLISAVKNVLSGSRNS